MEFPLSPTPCPDSLPLSIKLDPVDLPPYVPWEHDARGFNELCICALKLCREQLDSLQNDRMKSWPTNVADEQGAPFCDQPSHCCCCIVHAFFQHQGLLLNGDATQPHVL